MSAQEKSGLSLSADDVSGSRKAQIAPLTDREYNLLRAVFVQVDRITRLFGQDPAWNGLLDKIQHASVAS